MCEPPPVRLPAQHPVRHCQAQCRQRFYRALRARRRSDAQLTRIREIYEAMAARLGHDIKAAVDAIVVADALPGWSIRMTKPQIGTRVESRSNSGIRGSV